MGLETFSFISNLVPSNPESADNTSQGDDHIRGVKQTLQNTFPGADQAHARAVGDEAADDAKPYIWTPQGLLAFMQARFVIPPPPVLGESFAVNNGGTQQNVSASTQKAVWSTAEFGTFDLAGNRHIPTTAGIWNYNAALWFDADGNASTTYVYLQLRKNGNIVKEIISQGVMASGQAFSLQIEGKVEMNGSTDFVELWVRCDKTNTQIQGNATQCYFEGLLIGSSA